jgi:PelA/Pel-15E family pectate lyase
MVIMHHQAAFATQNDDDKNLRANVLQAMKTATTFWTTHVAVQGGYVYKVTLDLKYRKGEGTATATEIWVQPPGTPEVGGAFLDAWDATGDNQFLDAACACADALIFGQMDSGGWSDRVDFDPAGRNTGRYRDGRGKSKGRRYSTLDDDKTQSALRLLIRLDKTLKYQNAETHEAVQFALDRLLQAQFANGGFPQGWQQPVKPGNIVKASYPEYDWRSEGRIKEYHDYPTLNDGLAGTVTATLHLAWTTYQDPRYRDALLRFGDFLILAQLPAPQPAWAQQYNSQLQPMWARKFEPPAIAGRESEDVLETLLFLADVLGEPRFLEPIPAALDWLKRSELSDGVIARFYELQTNTPLYLTKDSYELTYSDLNLPTHYSFKSQSRVKELEMRYKELLKGRKTEPRGRSLKTLTKDAQRILSERSESGLWVTDDKGRMVTTTSGKDPSTLWLESRQFSQRLSRLAEFLQAEKLSAKTAP